jgi:hypothetical protein
VAITSYVAKGRRLYRIDEWIDLPDGTRKRELGVVINAETEANGTEQK